MSGFEMRAQFYPLVTDLERLKEEAAEGVPYPFVTEELLELSPKAADLALAAGARRCLPLNVSGAFHTLLMHPAGDALREKFQSIHFAPMQFPVLFNCLGHEMAQNDTVATLLEKQVQFGVRWEATVRRLAELGVDTAIEIGPGRVLTGFVKKTVGNAISCYPVETAAQLQQLLCTMKGA